MCEKTHEGFWKHGHLKCSLLPLLSPSNCVALQTQAAAGSCWQVGRREALSFARVPETHCKALPLLWSRQALG